MISHVIYAMADIKMNVHVASIQKSRKMLLTFQGNWRLNSSTQIYQMCSCHQVYSWFQFTLENARIDSASCKVVWFKKANNNCATLYEAGKTMTLSTVRLQQSA